MPCPPPLSPPGLQEFAKGGKLGKLAEAVKSAGLEIEKVRTKREMVDRVVGDELERSKTLEKAIEEVR